jgi:hypothetical protein
MIIVRTVESTAVHLTIVSEHDSIVDDLANNTRVDTRACRHGERRAAE